MLVTDPGSELSLLLVSSCSNAFRQSSLEGVALCGWLLCGGASGGFGAGGVWQHNREMEVGQC